MQSKTATYVLLILATLSWQTAHGYIDPGTGSVLIQGILAAIAAVGVTLKLYWHRFVRLFRRSSDNERNADQKSSEASSAATDD